MKILTILLAVLFLSFFVMNCALNSLAGNAEEVQAVLPNLSALADGTYLGEYTLGPVRVRAQVSLKNGTLTEIRLLEHDNGIGSKAETIVDSVLREQSLDVDCISGATVSSKCILKAIEAAFLP